MFPPKKKDHMYKTYSVIYKCVITLGLFLYRALSSLSFHDELPLRIGPC
ncbi:Uncharacterized protein APZ42_018866 [Daphnia magna]|uniref:Uncharacterized protein n=1 Tax=Daphnia magna TaxID=35525 RepID=A0A164YUS4_9CRUS|nr:Uncharacterized protein APZ42_018866 [Daphnia magna]